MNPHFDNESARIREAPTVTQAIYRATADGNVSASDARALIERFHDEDAKCRYGNEQQKRQCYTASRDSFAELQTAIVSLSGTMGLRTTVSPEDKTIVPRELIVELYRRAETFRPDFHRPIDSSRSSVWWDNTAKIWDQVWPEHIETQIVWRLLGASETPGVMRTFIANVRACLIREGKHQEAQQVGTVSGCLANGNIRSVQEHANFLLGKPLLRIDGRLGPRTRRCAVASVAKASGEPLACAVDAFLQQYVPDETLPTVSVVDTMNANGALDRIFQGRTSVPVAGRYSYLQENKCPSWHISREAFMDLCAIMQAEAGTGNIEGCKAVAYVVLNRIRSSQNGRGFEGTVHDVIMQSGQFSPTRLPHGRGTKFIHQRGHIDSSTVLALESLLVKGDSPGSIHLQTVSDTAIFFNNSKRPCRDWGSVSCIATISGNTFWQYSQAKTSGRPSKRRTRNA